MIKLDNNVMTMVRKDTGSVTFSLTNYTLTDGDIVKFTVAEEAGMQYPSFQKVVTTFNEGVAEIGISSHDSNLEPGTYYYDIEVDRQDGQIDTVIGPAKFKIIEGVTY